MKVDHIGYTLAVVRNVFYIQTIRVLITKTMNEEGQ